MTVRPVVLAGGGGTRLWPLSTPSRPKQLLALAGTDALLPATLDRIGGLATATTMVVCGEAQSDEVRGALAGRDVQVVVEPSGRSTAPALALAAALAAPDDVLVVVPSDHLVADADAFGSALATGVELAEEGHVVVFGVVPDRPATGYGWIRRGHALEDGRAHRVAEFTEKPDATIALRHLTEGLLWNSGMVCVRAGVYLDELARHRPDVSAAVASATTEAGIDAEAWGRVPSVSVDVAVLEPTELAVVVALDAGWSDVGSWDSLWRALSPGGDANVLSGQAVALDTSGSLVWATSRRVVVIGVEDLVVVETPEAVLVVPRSRADSVRDPA